MQFQVVGVSHLTASWATLAALGKVPANELLTQLITSNQQIAGGVVLATCNRFEIVLDTASTVDPVSLVDQVVAAIGTVTPEVALLAAAQLEVQSGEAAIANLFQLGAGLRSAILGDRQVAGQLRRAYEQATAAGFCTARLHRLFNAVLHTSHLVNATTALGTIGKSIASAGLDMLTATPERVVLIGSGALACVVIGELLARGVTDISCWSASGRAAQFAQRHAPARALADDDLPRALSVADLVITCSGNGPVLSSEDLQNVKPLLPVIDLSLSGDLSPVAAKLPSIKLYTIENIINANDFADAEVIAAAKQVVHQQLSHYLSAERHRGADSIITALSNQNERLIADEIRRLAGHVSEAELQTVERSLRHVFGKTLHLQITRLVELAEKGQLPQVEAVAATIFGLSDQPGDCTFTPRNRS